MLKTKERESAGTLRLPQRAIGLFTVLASAALLLTGCASTPGTRIANETQQAAAIDRAVGTTGADRWDAVLPSEQVRQNPLTDASAIALATRNDAALAAGPRQLASANDRAFPLPPRPSLTADDFVRVTGRSTRDGFI
ncbi:MAG: hypothetical protein AAF747_11705, partial [Planctomycetota bacterium]